MKLMSGLFAASAVNLAASLSGVLLLASPTNAQTARECARAASLCASACAQATARAAPSERAARSAQLRECRTACNEERQSCQQSEAPAPPARASPAPGAISPSPPAAPTSARVHDFVQLAAVDEQIQELPLRDRIGGRHYAVGEDGSIAFGARLKDGGHALFVANGRSVRTVATTTPGRYTNLLITTDLGLNRRGEVLFSAEMGPGRRVLVRSGRNGDEILAEGAFLIDSNERGTALYTKPGGLYVRTTASEMRVGAVGGEAALNASDMVAYWDGESITLWRDGQIVPQATPAPRLMRGWLRTDQPLKINNAGSYLLLAQLPQIPNGQSLVLRSGGRSIPIADNAGDAYSRFVRADINDREEVAFIARMSNSTNAAFVYREGRIENLSGLREVSGGVEDIAISAGGVVVYGDHTGLWLGPDQGADRILRNGDTLLGRRVSTVRLLGINDAGQVFFTAAFGKGSQGTMLVRADPR